MRPTVEGYYWYRDPPPKDSIYIDRWQVVHFDGRLFWIMGNELDRDFDELPGEFFGPIVPPETT